MIILRNTLSTKKLQKRLKSVNTARNIGSDFIRNSEINECERENLEINKHPPWIHTNSYQNITFNNSLAEKIKKSDAKDRIQNVWNNTYNSLPKANIEIWTDGSAINGTNNGGSGIVISEGNNKHEIVVPAGKLTSSYRAELTALLTGLTWINENVNRRDLYINFFTDSQSAISKLNCGPTATTNKLEQQIWNNILTITNRLNMKMNFQWCPSHVDIEFNERADVLAKQGTQLDQTNSPIDFQTTKKYIQRKLRHDWEFSQKRINTKDEKELPRKQRRILAQLRSPDTKCPLLKTYLFNIGRASTPKCDFCDETTADLEHLIVKCPQLQKHRLDQLGQDASINDLWDRPGQVAKMLAMGGRLGDRR